MSRNRIKELEFLIGQWHGKGTSYGTGGSDKTEVSRKDAFSWLPGGHFIVADDELVSDNWTLNAHWIFGYDTQTQEYKLFAFDSLNCQRIYTSSGIKEQEEFIFTGTYEQLVIKKEKDILVMIWNVRKSDKNEWSLMCRTSSLEVNHKAT